MNPPSFRSTAVDLVLLIALVAGCYALRLPDLSIRGEESRWATVAREMQRRGDWVVPRQQGQPFLSRPPMGSWLIAGAATIRGACDPVAVRLPSLLAVLATTLLIYGYGRTFLGRLGALGASAGFATMPEILQMGRLAESDIIFTCFLGGALLVWHWGFRNGWPPTMTWGSAYLLAGLATLTKGPQAPVYFGATVGLYLVSTRQWRCLISPGHLLGLAVYTIVVGAWLAPFYVQMGWPDTWKILAGDSADRFVGLNYGAIATHVALYPFEVLGCTAPWSYLLVAFASRRFRQSLAHAGPHVRFLALSLLVSFPTCWITPGGQTRYLMPLYPCVALLAGIVVDRLMMPAPWLRRALSGLRHLTALVMLASALAVAGLTWFIDDPIVGHWKQPPVLAALLVCGTLLAAVMMWRSGLFSLGRLRLAGLLMVPVFMGGAYSGVVVNQLCASSERAAEKIQALKEWFPEERRLASIGPVHHKFAYEFARPIELISENNDDVLRWIPPGGWYCYISWNDERKTLPFEYEELAAISMDRYYSPQPQVQVIVARRCGSPATSGSKQLTARQP